MNGTEGLPGAVGSTGPVGVKGVQGDQGVEGEKGDIGTTGMQGQQGLRGVSATDSALISWNECTWLNLNSGIDYGQIAVSLQSNQTHPFNETKATLPGQPVLRLQCCCYHCYGALTMLDVIVDIVLLLVLLLLLVVLLCW